MLAKERKEMVGESHSLQMCSAAMHFQAAKGTGCQHSGMLKHEALSSGPQHLYKARHDHEYP